MTSTRTKWLTYVAIAAAAFIAGVWAFGTPSDVHTTEATTAATAETWTCSMHPHVQQSEPGACPICGMDLVPVTSESGSTQPTTVTLSERAKVLARIRTTPVKRLGEASAERRMLGRVDYDETSLRTVTAWVGGRIDRLHVSATGEQVKRGQAIATLYSPEVYSAHFDLLGARQQLERLEQGATPSAIEAARAALSAARDRLRLLGVPDAELSTMERASKPSERIRIRSPFSGTVIERLATQGSYVNTGTGLYRIANLSRLWVQLDAYESDLGSLDVGQSVALDLEALPGQPFEGKVTFVDPVLDEKTRTARVRIEVRNPDGKLRPGMFAQAVLKGSQRGKEDTLVVPATAPLFTGHRSMVYVQVPEQDGPTYEARVVELGARVGDYYPIVSGLEQGERVVVHGAFVLDADLQIRGGRSMMNASDEPPHHEHKDHAGHQGHAP